VDEQGSFTPKDIVALTKAGVPKELWTDPRVTELDRRELLELIEEGGGTIEPVIVEALLEHVQSRPLYADEAARVMSASTSTIEIDHEPPIAFDDEPDDLTDDEWEADFQRMLATTPQYQGESPVVEHDAALGRLGSVTRRRSER
jgi:hypothetical protein